MSIDGSTGAILSRKDFDAAGNIIFDSIAARIKAQAERNNATAQAQEAVNFYHTTQSELSRRQQIFDQLAVERNSLQWRLNELESQRSGIEEKYLKGLPNNNFFKKTFQALREQLKQKELAPVNEAINAVNAELSFKQSQLNAAENSLNVARNTAQNSAEAKYASESRLNLSKAKLQAEINRDNREGIANYGKYPKTNLPELQDAAARKAAEEAKRQSELNAAARQEAERAASAKQEAEHTAAEEARRAEAQRIAAEQQAKAAAEQETARQAAAKAEADRIASERVEAERKAQQAREIAQQQEQQKRQMEELRKRQEAERKRADEALRQQMEQNRKMAQEMEARRQREEAERKARQDAMDAERERNRRIGGGRPGVSIGIAKPPIPGTRPGPWIGMPVALDLNGDGIIDIKPLSAGQPSPSDTPHFDWTGDGVADLTAWIGPNDGLLVIDLSFDGTPGADGKINQAREIAFSLWKTEDERQAELKEQGIDDSGRPVTDLEGLRYAFDTNGDGNP